MAVVIVGASVAGVRTAQALRLAGHGGQIVVIGDEPHHPYDRPPLSKQMLDVGAGEPVALVAADQLAALDLDLRLGHRAVKLDPERAQVSLDDGTSVGYRDLVVATGARARTLPGLSGRRGVHTLRSLSDLVELRAQLDLARNAVVVGAGFIGAEFASAARARGVAVTNVEAQTVPMVHLLGPEVGGLLAGLHAANGVSLHTGVQVTELVGAGRVEGAMLSDGRTIPADMVVVGIGAVPCTDWIEGSGLPVGDGVECDESLRVIGFPRIYAAGDVARFRHPLFGVDLRIEHWTNANEHAAIVAAGITGSARPAVQAPYVWSDQYGHRIQIVGRPARGSLAALSGGVGAADRPLVAVYADSAATVVGAVVVDDSRTLMKLRKAVARRRTVQELQLDSPTGA